MSTETENEELAKRQAAHRVDLVNSYKDVFGTEDGKTVLYDLMKKGYFLTTTLSPDKCRLTTNRNEGMRELVVLILEMIQTDAKSVQDIILNGDESEKEYYL